MIKINFKFGVGDVVWFYEYETGKYLEGTITEAISWNKWDGWRIEVEHYNEKGEQVMYNVEESKLFLNKEEILMNLFQENGTPKEETNEGNS
jgi:hypothetical protein